MKKAEDIKKGLECCDFEHWQGRKCEECPYMNAHDEWCDNMDEIRSDAIAYTRQLEAQVPKWISVEERLPENTDNVLITDGDIVIVGWLSSCHNWYSEDLLATLKVTHWMKLPEPPKEDAQ